MISLRRTAALVLALAGLLLPAPAQAATGAAEDGTGDVWISVDGGETRSYAGASPNTDLTGVTVRHLRERVTVRAEVADLAPRPTDATSVVVKLVIDTGAEFYLSGSMTRSGAAAVRVYNVGFQPYHCGGATAGVVEDRDVLLASVPRSCLGEPRSFAWQSYLTTVRTTPEHRYVFFDAAATDAAGPGETYQASLPRG